MTVYSNKQQGGFAGSEPVSEPENFRCAFDLSPDALSRTGNMRTSLAAVLSDERSADRCVRRARRRGSLLALCSAASLRSCAGASAGAVILPATTIDGPSPEIVGFGGVAMAEDGTGGLVFLKKVNGVAHVFVSRYVGGHWLAPIQVDRGDPYAASWPRIGAADNGELVVVWATPFATEKEEGPNARWTSLLGSTLGAGVLGIRPGSDRRSRHRRCHRNQSGPGDELDRPGGCRLQGHQQRAARSRCCTRAMSMRKCASPTIEGERWLDLGAINRDPGVSMRPPTPANAPQIAINADRQRGRRLAGAGNQRGRAHLGAGGCSAPTSTTCSRSARRASNGAPIEGEADAPSVAISLLGQAEVAYRQAAGPGLAAAGAADLPEHAARRRIGKRRCVHRARSSPTRTSPVGPPRKSGRRASTSTNSVNCACSTTTTAPRT